MNLNKVINVTCQGSAQLRPDEFKEFQGNLKTLSEENYQKLKKAIADPKIGFSFPIFVWKNKKTNYIIDGHQRLIAIRRMVQEGWTIRGGKLPVDWIKAADIKTAKKKVILAVSQYGIYDEKSFLEFLETAEMDFNELKEIIELPQIDLEQFAIDWEKHIHQGTQDEDKDDEVPPLPKKAKSKMGDLYLLGEHRLLCGDSTNREDIERLMDGKKADLVFTDPPYNVQKENEEWDSKTISEYTIFTKSWFKNAKDFSSVILFTSGTGRHLINLEFWFQIEGPNWMLIWQKNNTLTHNPIGGFQAWEPILLYGQPRKRIPQDVYICPIIVQKDVEQNGHKLHPTPKQVKLWVMIIEDFTKINNVIFDPFLGSGTTLIACEKIGRICYGMEIEPLYCDVILDRWANYTGKDPIREDGVKWSKVKNAR